MKHVLLAALLLTACSFCQLLAADPTHPAHLPPGPVVAWPPLAAPAIIAPARAAAAARALVLKNYLTGKTGLRCFAYCKPKSLVNWTSPEVTFLKTTDTPKYWGPAWEVHFTAPQRPGIRPNFVELPGDGFRVLMTQDGRLLYFSQAYD